MSSKVICDGCQTEKLGNLYGDMWASFRRPTPIHSVTSGSSTFDLCWQCAQRVQDFIYKLRDLATTS